MSYHQRQGAVTESGLSLAAGKKGMQKSKAQEGGSFRHGGGWLPPLTWAPASDSDPDSVARRCSTCQSRRPRGSCKPIQQAAGAEAVRQVAPERGLGAAASGGAATEANVQLECWAKFVGGALAQAGIGAGSGDVIVALSSALLSSSIANLIGWRRQFQHDLQLQRQLQSQLRFPFCAGFRCAFACASGCSSTIAYLPGLSRPPMELTIVSIQS